MPGLVLVSESELGTVLLQRSWVLWPWSHCWETVSVWSVWSMFLLFEGQVGAGKQTIFRIAVHFPPVPAELWTLSPDSPASPSAQARRELWLPGRDRAASTAGGREPAPPGHWVWALGVRPCPPPALPGAWVRALPGSPPDLRLERRPWVFEGHLANTKRSSPSVSTRGAQQLFKGIHKPWP